MGNSSVVGETMNSCGCTGALGFETSAKALINFHGIEPWNARELVKENLRRQGDLARRSPLHSIPIEDGLKYIGRKAQGWFLTKLTREQFAQTCMELLLAKNIPHTPKDRDDLYQIFDSMDFDGNGSLSLGEWAGGLSVFFKGNTEQCVHAVFNVLDCDRSQTLTKKELQEYLKPFVKAMSPPEAESLRPILLKKATDDIYDEMDLDHSNDISSQEMLEWTQRGNNIIDRLADIIDKEVYQIWLAEHDKRMVRERLYGSNDACAVPATVHPDTGAEFSGPSGEQVIPADGAGYNGPAGEQGPWHGERKGGGSPEQRGPSLQQHAYSRMSRDQQLPPHQQQRGGHQSPSWGPPLGSGWGSPGSPPPPLSRQGWGGPPGQQLPQGGPGCGRQPGSNHPGDQRWQPQSVGGGHPGSEQRWPQQGGGGFPSLGGQQRHEHLQSRLPPPPPPPGPDPFRGSPLPPQPPPHLGGGPPGGAGYGSRGSRY